MLVVYYCTCCCIMLRISAVVAEDRKRGGGHIDIFLFAETIDFKTQKKTQKYEHVREAEA